MGDDGRERRAAVPADTAEYRGEHTTHLFIWMRADLGAAGVMTGHAGYVLMGRVIAHNMGIEGQNIAMAIYTERRLLGVRIVAFGAVLRPALVVK